MKGDAPAGRRTLDEDTDLVAQARAGRTRAFEELVQRHQRAALRVAYAIAGSDAEDVVQEAFVKAFRNLGRFRLDAPFRPWMLRIVANEARNARRSAGRRGTLAFRARDDTTASSAEEEAVAAHRRQVLALAVSRLPERDRLVIAYRWFAGLTEAEMAAALGCRPGTVKSRLSRAHERLRAVLGTELTAADASEVGGTP